ncbi:hypothetical protein INP83_05040 [Mucilaginibacter sp. 21P]|uniref:hypothetical protein n=1 Tax=Mucilaginibacter sp. 21P TaxID=2778902 RepID=UPI001C55BDBF|nr:hypothetical protein [Mucilaginibacter sp. 21P]QXV66452.1 hypothetical protein INP83_05040 [Mucilaginibacter sp. 21P]
MKDIETVSLRELEHGYFMDLVYDYMKRNDVLTFDFHYDKRHPEESGEILVYDPHSDCGNSKQIFIQIE